MSTVLDDEGDDGDCVALITVISLIGGVSLTTTITIVIGVAIKRKNFKFSKCKVSNVSQIYTFIMKKMRRRQPTEDTEDVIELVPTKDTEDVIKLALTEDIEDVIELAPIEI